MFRNIKFTSILFLVLSINLLLSFDGAASNHSEKLNTENQSVASGFFINDAGFIITSFHVINNKKKKFALLSKTKGYPAKSH